jgi:hypothetical protein
MYIIRISDIAVSAAACGSDYCVCAVYEKKSGDAQSSHFSTTIDESTASPLGGY